MKVATAVVETGLQHSAQHAVTLERLGYDRAFNGDYDHDAFLALAVAASHTTTIELATQIAVAFARTPMPLAILANDMQILSHGRFTLGLGTQVKAHIVRRFDMPWNRPVERLTEMISAIKAIWTAWETGEKLDFHGEFYNNSLMTPALTPRPHEFGRPRITAAAVGPAMTEAVAASCDGVLTHGFSNERHLREVTIPAVERGLARAGKIRQDIEISAPGFIVTGATDAGLAAQREQARRDVSFYGSTPAYRGTLAVHGWGELADELHRLSVTGDPDRWDTMARLVDDDMLETFAVIAEPSRLAAAILARYGDLVDTVWLPRIPGLPDEETMQIIAELHAAESDTSTIIIG